MPLAVTANGGVLAPAGRAEVKALRVEKRVDRASPTLHAQTCLGQLYDTMVLTKILELHSKLQKTCVPVNLQAKDAFSKLTDAACKKRRNQLFTDSLLVNHL